MHLLFYRVLKSLIIIRLYSVIGIALMIENSLDLYYYTNWYIICFLCGVFLYPGSLCKFVVISTTTTTTIPPLLVVVMIYISSNDIYFNFSKVTF